VSFSLSHDPELLDRNLVIGWLTESSYWATGRAAAVQASAIDGSLNVGAYVDGQQVGYARLVTDYATFGWICDVFVLPDHQGQGIARAMVRALIDHPSTASVGRFMLATKDAHGVYGALGFAPVADPGRWMEWRRS
jgi:GNAT superfamily N-acetyltransferase